ncbi:MAG: hypothetical protein ABIR91_01000 [Candidatus Saccharimonadales bacterium]
MENHTRLSRALSAATLGLGLWLMLSPVVLNYQLLGATAQQTIIGIVVVLVGGVRLSLPHVNWPSWIGVILGAQLIVMPLHLAASGSAIDWNATIIGLLLLAISMRSAIAHPLFSRSAL